MTTVWLAANTLRYPRGGGHLWAYMNWALGLRACGCDLVWLEGLPAGCSTEEAERALAGLKTRLARYGLQTAVALHIGGEPIAGLNPQAVDLELASEADLLIDMSYATHAALTRRFRKSALLDIDPGLTQIWVDARQFVLAPHDLYFTIGETVGRPEARFPDCGLDWIYTPPCISLTHWRPAPGAGHAYTTVSQWYAKNEWVLHGDDSYDNSKRAGFLDYLDLPGQTAARLELALSLGNDTYEEQNLRGRGWAVREAETVASTPWDYQAYVQGSRGEFSCVKPSCVRLQNAWISDRTLCYLASGRPAVVQHTGPSRILPDDAGLLRFRTPEEAVQRLAQAEAGYDRHAKAARQLVEEVFDARKVAGRVLERCL
ncbi:MAG: hypothetical protein ABIO39_09640 [Caulobacteraceae bacterium]